MESERTSPRSPRLAWKGWIFFGDKLWEPAPQELRRRHPQRIEVEDMVPRWNATQYLEDLQWILQWSFRSSATMPTFFLVAISIQWVMVNLDLILVTFNFQTYSMSNHSAWCSEIRTTASLGSGNSHCEMLAPNAAVASDAWSPHDQWQPGGWTKGIWTSKSKMTEWYLHILKYTVL